MSQEIITTQDGSHSLHSSVYEAAYHSHYGAIDEAITIFISGGLHYLRHKQKKEKIRIFEMGLGTGLNAYLSAIFSEKHDIEIEYDSIELHPVAADIYQNLNYKDSLQSPQLFDKIHTCQWNETVSVSPSFKIKKIEGDILSYRFDSQYDMILFDAFAPSSQPLLWEAALHARIYNQVVPGGCLLTYCAKGVFKRMLKSLGYQLEMLPGPAKKKEITRAIKY